MALAAQQTFSLRTQLTAQLAQTMRLLQLSTIELTTLIESELAVNPALEVAQESRCASCGRRLRTFTCPICDRRSAVADEPIVYLSARSVRGRETDFIDEIELRATETLAEYVWRQIAPSLAMDDRPLAEYLLANLDEHGFLLETPENCAEILHLPLDRVCAVLRMIQQADPPGIGVRDVRESLLVQLDSLNDSEASRSLARRLIADHWEQLSQHPLRKLANQLHVTPVDIEAAVSFIRRNLTPYPAQAYWGNRRGQPAEATYTEPDAIIHAPLDGHDEPLSIELFSPVAGWLRVNDAFKSALDDCPVADRQRLTECVAQAELLVRGFQQRTTTLRRVLEVIGREQRAYLTGVEDDPKPMTRARLAQQLSVHESTVSRAVADKLVALPNGRIVSLDHFFDQSLAARRALKTIIAVEERPLTDDELAQRLAERGHVIARRTVVKYRELENIPTAPERAKHLRFSIGTASARANVPII
jgi:RNA polymerase sigma-54 factor